MKVNLPPGLKRCACCKLDKTADDDFGVDRRRPDGLNVYCKSCIRSKSAQAREADPEKHREWNAKERERNPERKMVDSARRRAIIQNVPFTITRKDIHVPGLCPICQREMMRAVGQKSHWSLSPTLDKWEPELGYIPGNVWVICMDCNNKKGSMSGNEMIAFGWKLIESWKAGKNSV